MLYLYHYYEREKGAFNNLSELDLESAKEIMDEIKKEGTTFASQRDESYLVRRKELEQKIKEEFIKKGGIVERETPLYMVIGECEFLHSWYKNGQFIKIPISEFDTKTLSFTYGDSFPTFSERVHDDYEFRHKVYTYEEILKIIDKYGLPQLTWKKDVFAKPAYVEVQVWSNKTIEKYRK